MLACLNLFNNSVSTASALVFEKHTDLSDELHFIKLVYKDGHDDKFKVLSVPGEHENYQRNFQLQLR